MYFTHSFCLLLNGRLQETLQRIIVRKIAEQFREEHIIARKLARNYHASRIIVRKISADRNNRHRENEEKFP